MNKLESDWISLSQRFVQNGWVQYGKIQDGCHQQINQIELVWVRFRVEWGCFWVNLIEDNMVSESKMAVSESNMEEFKMAAIIKLSQNEWVKFLLCKMAESKKAKFKMTDILELSENEWVKSQIELVWVRVLCKMPESKMAKFQDGWHHQVN